ncbi:hydrolase [Thermococcus sp. EP1]|nr:hydrolase [Thermococcus sp. EP1]
MSLFEVNNMIPIEIPPNTVMLRGVGYDSNIYLFRDGEEGLIVDTGTGVYWHRYFEVFEREDYLRGLRRVIILSTHEHFDHVGGNRRFKEFFERMGLEVSFAAHEVAAEVLEKGDDYVILSYAYGRKFAPQRVDLFIKDKDVLRIGRKELIVLHTPGHTAGSVCIYEPKEKLLFTGDTLFKGSVGRTDLPTGDFKDLVTSLEKLEGIEVDIALPGHGRPILDWKKNLKDIQKYLGVIE